MTLDHYSTAKTAAQRAAIVDYLQHLDRKLATSAVIDHIVAAHNGIEATAYSALLETLKPDGCAALLDRLAKASGAVPKGKLIVALRHCENPEAITALAACLEDKRPVPFEAHGAHPRRVCDLAYDELFLKLRANPRYGLDASPHMRGILTERVPVKDRDAKIATLKSELAAAPAPIPSPSPAASAAPSPSPSVKKPLLKKAASQ